MNRIARFGLLCLTAVMLLLGGVQLLNVPPALAATIDNLNATCQYVTVRGKTEVNTSFVRVQVVLASNLTTVISQQVVPTRPRAGAAYKAVLDIRKAHLTEGTLLVISVGEWDGTRYLRPATLTSIECNHNGGTRLPTPTPLPTLVASPTFVGTLPPTYTPPSSTLPPMSPTPPPTDGPFPTNPPPPATPTPPPIPPTFPGGNS